MNSVAQLQAIHKNELVLVQEELLNILKSPVHIIEELGQHIFNAGGKKIRPLLTLTCAKNFREDISKEIISIAAAVECIHTATLVHDDVLDDSKLRRGVKTANALWGNTCSILVGDFLFAKAFELMVQSKDLKVLEMLSRTSTKICQGEVKQMTMTDDIDASKEDYFYVVEQKTGALFAAACKAGAMIGGASDEDCAHIEEYGFQLGRAFQIIDDILDYVETEKNLGKTPGDDYKEGKITLPILELFKVNHTARDLFKDPNKTHFDVLKKMMIDGNVFEHCYSEIEEITKNALEALQKISAQKYIQHLKVLVMELNQRTQ
jgi:octaprenyl-diphosphate synthase